MVVGSYNLNDKLFVPLPVMTNKKNADLQQAGINRVLAILVGSSYDLCISTVLR